MRTLTALFLLSALTGCGQTGPLQMPPAPREAPPPPPAVAPQVENGETNDNSGE